MLRLLTAITLALYPVISFALVITHIHSQEEMALYAASVVIAPFVGLGLSMRGR